MSARHWAGGLCLAAPLLLFACDKGPSATTEGEVVRPPAKVECQQAPEGGSVVTGLADGCPFWLQASEDGSIEVRSLADGSSRTGALPFSLSHADLEPVATSHGLLVLVSEVDPDSDVPLSAGALLPGGEGMQFVVLWDRRLGDDSTGDKVSLGPPFGLAPVDCKEGIGFKAMGRLPSASEESPSQAIAERAGLYGEGGRVGDLPDGCDDVLAPPL